MKYLVSLSILLLLSACGGSSDDTQPQATRLQLKALAENDIAVSSVDSTLDSTAMPAVNDAREDVSVDFAVDDTSTPIHTLAKPQFRAESRQYHWDIDGELLAKGVSLPLSSSAPVLRLIAIDEAVMVKLADIEMKPAGGSWQAAEKMFAVVADKDALTAAGMPTQKSTLAGRLKSVQDLQSIDLRSKSAHKGQQYRVHVLEPDSTMVLNVEAANTSPLQGEVLQVQAKLQAANSTLDIAKSRARLVDPAGHDKGNVPVQITPEGLHAEIDTSALVSTTAGLWELQLQVEHEEAQQRILRDIKVAFAVNAKTARLLPEVQWQLTDDSAAAQLHFALETQLPGRYEISAVIYGHDSEGKLVPGVVTAAARWLDANGEIALPIARERLWEAGIEAPYSLRHLRLHDQTRMSVLHAQAHALDLPTL